MILKNINRHMQLVDMETKLILLRFLLLFEKGHAAWHDFSVPITSVLDRLIVMDWGMQMFVVFV